MPLRTLRPWCSNSEQGEEDLNTKDAKDAKALRRQGYAGRAANRGTGSLRGGEDAGGLVGLTVWSRVKRNRTEGSEGSSLPAWAGREESPQRCGDRGSLNGLQTTDYRRQTCERNRP
jgi:hypothetical protein